MFSSVYVEKHVGAAAVAPASSLIVDGKISLGEQSVVILHWWFILVINVSST